MSTTLSSKLQRLILASLGRGQKKTRPESSLLFLLKSVMKQLAVGQLLQMDLRLGGSAGRKKSGVSEGTAQATVQQAILVQLMGRAFPVPVLQARLITAEARCS